MGQLLIAIEKPTCKRNGANGNDCVLQLLFRRMPNGIEGNRGFIGLSERLQRKEKNPECQTMRESDSHRRSKFTTANCEEIGVDISSYHTLSSYSGIGYRIACYRYVVYALLHKHGTNTVYFMGPDSGAYERTASQKRRLYGPLRLGAGVGSELLPNISSRFAGIGALSPA